MTRLPPDLRLRRSALALTSGVIMFSVSETRVLADRAARPDDRFRRETAYVGLEAGSSYVPVAPMEPK